ncbi:MAG: J domain-containing protein [Myxococcota bacterium]
MALGRNPPLTPEDAKRLRDFYSSLDEISHYELLGIDLDADAQQIRRAYYEMSKRWHPDMYRDVPLSPEQQFQVESIFAVVNQAYQVLKKNRSRARYDLDLMKRPPRMTARRTRDRPPLPPGPSPKAKRPPARFKDTADVLSFGMKLGVGKAAQNRALALLQAQWPHDGTMMETSLFHHGVRLALPLVGMHLAERLTDPQTSRRVREVSEGMLLVNTIDVASDITQSTAQSAIEVAQVVLSLFGVSGPQADESARQLIADLGLPAGSAARAVSAEAG